MKKINVLRCCYWRLVLMCGSTMATIFPEWTFKGFIMPLIVMPCAMGAGYVDRMIDEEKEVVG